MRIPGGVTSGIALACLCLLTGGAFAQRTLTVAPVPGEQRVALVIGNGSYKNAAPLANPPNDARLMAETLAALGFRLVGGRPLVNADKAGMERAIREFGRLLRGGAVGLFYYAGHGVQVRGENYLIPVEANVASESDVKYELVNAGHVLDEMSNAGNRLNMLILDACRNNPFGGRGLRSASNGLAQVTAPAGTVISYATQPGNTAADGAGRNSPFTTALAASMRKPGMGVFDTFNEVGLAVKNATGGQQQPWLATSPIEGGFQFAAGAALASTAPSAGAASPAPVVAIDPAANERVFWDSVKDSRSVDEFKAYLDQYPNGLFTALAAARMRALESSVVAPKPAPAPAETWVSFGGDAAPRNAVMALTGAVTAPIRFDLRGGIESETLDMLRPLFPNVRVGGGEGNPAAAPAYRVAVSVHALRGVLENPFFGGCCPVTVSGGVDVAVTAASGARYSRSARFEGSGSFPRIGPGGGTPEVVWGPIAAVLISQSVTRSLRGIVDSVDLVNFARQPAPSGAPLSARP